MIGGRKVGGYKLPMFRKELLINKEVKEAIVNISGLGHFDFYVNGEKVGNHFLDPGWTNYAKTALYLTFDVTPLLKKRMYWELYWETAFIMYLVSAISNN